MNLQLSPIARASARRMVAMSASGALYLVWDNAFVQLPNFDLPHLAGLLDGWEHEEDPAGMRRGYYRVSHSADGALMLWLNGVALALSRDDLRVLSGLLRTAGCSLEQLPESLAAAPFGPHYEPLAAGRGWNN
jgi:hypothetical protein